jgi:hypothetical protein
MFGGQRSWIALSCSYYSVICCFVQGSFCLISFLLKKFSLNIYYSLPATEIPMLISSSILPLLLIKDQDILYLYLFEVPSRSTLHRLIPLFTPHNHSFSFSCNFIYSNFHVPLYISKTLIPHCSTWCTSKYEVKTELLHFLKKNRTTEQTHLTPPTLSHNQLLQLWKANGIPGHSSWTDNFTLNRSFLINFQVTY